MKNKLNKIVDWLLLIIFVSGLLLYFIFLSSRSYQLTETSFEKIKILNSEILKLERLKNKKFKTKAELSFEAKELIEPNIFDEHYFLESYILEHKSDKIYSANLEYLKRMLSKDNYDFSSIKSKTYFVLDSLISDLHNVVGDSSFKIESYYTDYVNVYYYSVPPLEKLVLSDSLQNRLKEVKDICYKSDDEFEQEVKKEIGLEAYNNWGSFIRDVVDRHPSWHWIYLKTLIVSFLLIITSKIVLVYLIDKEKETESTAEIEKSISQAKENIKENPDKVLPVWDLANTTLQKYYNKNIEQVNSIYKLSIVVMVMGFMLIVSILISSIYFEVDVKHEQVGIIAGIITEFIGATFLFIYKSTINQAIQHSKSLEKINNVGMSIKIIESIKANSENEQDLSNAKIEIAKKLITTHNKS